jgi:hypothetical protein
MISFQSDVTPNAINKRLAIHCTYLVPTGEYLRLNLLYVINAKQKLALKDILPSSMESLTLTIVHSKFIANAFWICTCSMIFQIYPFPSVEIPIVKIILFIVHVTPITPDHLICG